MANKNLLIFRSVNSHKNIERLIIILIIFVILFIVSISEFHLEKETIFISNDKESEVFRFSLEVGKSILDKIYSYIILIILCLAFCCVKKKKKQIEIGQSEIKTIDRLFCIKIRSKGFLCETIDKTLIGMMPYKHNKVLYNIYLDQSNNISRIITLITYEECMTIMNQIKTVSRIKIYDGTDQLYRTEEDLFREYYKLKNLVNEIKNE
jgi:hypothetical protein